MMICLTISSFQLQYCTKCRTIKDISLTVRLRRQRPARLATSLGYASVSHYRIAPIEKRRTGKCK